jgi:hypothetical protein
MIPLIFACDAGPAWRKKFKEEAITLHLPRQERKAEHSVNDDGFVFLLMTIAIVSFLVARKLIK